MSPASSSLTYSPLISGLITACTVCYWSCIRRRRVLASNAQSFFLLSTNHLVYQSSPLCQTSLPSFSPLLTLWQIPGWVCLGSHGWVSRVACRGSGFQYCKWSPKWTANDRQWGSFVVLGIIRTTDSFLQSSCTCRCCLVLVGNKWGTHTSIHPDISCCTINAVAKMETRILDAIYFTYNGQSFNCLPFSFSKSP